MTSTKQKGDTGELIAIKYLQKQGFQIIETNFKYSRTGEIDIIAKKGEQTHFVEVKYRETDYFGSPEEAITPSKMKKILETIEYYVTEFELDFEQVQFDVIAIKKGEKSYQLKHYKNLGLEV